MTGRIDRDAARALLRHQYSTHAGPHEDAVLDALEGCVRPALSCGYVDCAQPDEPIIQREHGPEHPTCAVVQEYWMREERPAPAQTVDRDAIINIIDEERWSANGDNASSAHIADVVLALLRLVDGVTLTRDEATRVLTWRSRPGWPYDAGDDALAARLEAAQ